jgi:hypothetical protein
MKLKPPYSGLIMPAWIPVILGEEMDAYRRERCILATRIIGEAISIGDISPRGLTRRVDRTT